MTTTPLSNPAQPPTPHSTWTWETGDVSPDKTGEYLAAWKIGLEQYTYTVEMYYVDDGWETKAFLGFIPDFWLEIRRPIEKQPSIGLPRPSRTR